MAQVIAEMKRYKLVISGISESRRKRSGRMKTTTGDTVLYSGREDYLHYEGVATIMRKGMEKYLMEWKTVNSSIIQARLKGRPTKLSNIQCYAPTNDSNDRDKEDEQFQSTLVYRRELLLVIGDLNAKLRNRFQALSNIDEKDSEEEDTVNEQWKQVRNISDKASKTCLEMQKTRKKKEWITPETWQAIEEGRQLKKEIIDSRSARPRVSRNAPIRDKQGQLLTSEKEQEARWVEYFKEALNRPAPEEEPDILEAREDPSVDTGPPKKGETIL
ncbi:uncharacterized protein [Montipora foliosa]|uniref:uncharacterized protein n=1 Tax=Montipora foliosa TaxID=591990 RepID=UPI0035F1217C